MADSLRSIASNPLAKLLAKDLGVFMTLIIVLWVDFRLLLNGLKRLAHLVQLPCHRLTIENFISYFGQAIDRQ
jgi:hypothetical protein